MQNKGFTLIELIVVIAIISILSGIILFSVTQYINMGKDSNISGNLVVLIPAGEVFYNANGDSYVGFCASSVVTNAESQMPQNPSGDCQSNLAGVCCYDNSVNGDMWAACDKEFANSSNAYCVDSRGVKKEISNSACISTIASCN